MNRGEVPITIGVDLAEELRGWEEMTGGGGAAALKALKVIAGIHYRVSDADLGFSGIYCDMAWIPRLTHQVKTRI
jgi:hypothetical protein